jgi:soluble lytic murein transglycosylase
MKRVAALVIPVAVLASVVVLPMVAHAEKRHAAVVNDDDLFAALREAARRDDGAKAVELAARLPNYAIPSYVEYYRIKPRLRTVGPTEVHDFLKRYNGTAIADRLRNDWLLEVAHRRDWAEFDAQYPLYVANDDLQVKCYALMSKALKGQLVAEDARALLTSPRDYGEACNALIATLAQNGQFTDDDVWAQMRLAGEQGATPTARRISALTEVPENAVEGAIERPSFTLKKGVGKGHRSDHADHELFIIALGRTAKSNPDAAVRALNTAVPRLTPQEQAEAWAQIALQASYKLAPEALADYWNKTEGAPLSNEGYQWRVRMALRAGDWSRVKSGIETMPQSLRGNPVWVYWLGRALKAEGRIEEANRLFASIADQVHFYGQLSQEELGLKIMVPETTQSILPAEIAPFALNQGFKRATKFFDMNMRPEGVREWNWELRKLSEREHLAAAEFARQNNLLDRMVNTSDRTRYEFDFTQRYPSPYRDTMVTTTKALGLDMAWVYGLIRQESRFVMNARSQVGASGLMQVMPATAHFVARKIGLADYRKTNVNDTDINIQIGTNYLNMVLKDLDGSQALATAAYNAGPGRPRAWRSTLTRPVEGAIFAETIPFSETRGYVKNVLSNATYYAALFEGKPQSLKDRLGVVAPKGYVPSDLP